jgi:subtilisin family serine protease
MASLLLLSAAQAQNRGGGGGGGGGGDPGLNGEILLKLQSTAQLQPLLAKYSLTLKATLGARPLYRVQVPAGDSEAAIATALLLEPGVQIAEPNAVNQEPEARKNQVWAIGTQTDYQVQWGPAAMRLPEAQALSSGAGVRVAVLDTGVDFSHPALAGRLLPGRDFVDGDDDASEGGVPGDAAYGHGTHVAGLIALAAPGAKILPVRVLDAKGGGHMWAVAQAILYAVDPDGNPDTDDGAHVINLSLGSLSRSEIFDTIELLASCEGARRGGAVDIGDPGYANDRRRCQKLAGAVVLAAAGNDASSKTKQFPAAQSVKGLVSVAASDASHQVAGFSNSGNWIQVAAPGDHVTSSIPGGGYATWSGTSMAAPLVAGAVALYRALDFKTRPQDVVTRIEKATSLLCGTKLRQVDAVALVNGSSGADPACP